MGRPGLPVDAGLGRRGGRSFADTAGRKLLYTYGFGIFILGSALSGLAPSLPFLIAARVLQALGAAMPQANSVALIVQAMPKGMLGRGIGVQGAAQAVGLAVGPAIGGLLITAGGWRLIFFVSVPAGVIGMILGWFLLPRSRNLLEREPFDWMGLLFFVPAVTAPLAAISFGSDVGWTSPLILGSLILGLVFAARLRRHHGLSDRDCSGRRSFDGVARSVPAEACPLS